MSSFSQLAALCCIPLENAERRQQEREAFRAAVLERARRYAPSKARRAAAAKIVPFNPGAKARRSGT